MRWSAHAAIVTMLTAVTVSIALLAGAMHVYPGGTQWDPATRGNDFWENYLCDLARTVALDGKANPVGSALAQGAMSALVVGLVPFFWLLTRSFPSRAHLGAAVRGLGYAATASTLPVVLLPADRFSALHGIAILVAGCFGLLASLLAALGLVLEAPCPRLPAAVGCTTLLVALAAFIPYVRQFFVDGPGPVAAAALERLALLCLLAWMGAVAWHARDVCSGKR